MRKRRSRRADIKPALASMGDIAFLLIAFFVLVSNFTQDVSKELTQPKSVDIDKLKAAPDLMVIIDKHHRLYFDGKDVDNVDALQGLIQSAVEGREGERRRIVLKCDQSVTYDELQPVLKAFAENSVPVAMSGDQIQPGDLVPPRGEPKDKE